jgi:hypothetical protein
VQGATSTYESMKRLNVVAAIFGRFHQLFNVPLPVDDCVTFDNGIGIRRQVEFGLVGSSPTDPECSLNAVDDELHSPARIAIPSSA